MAQLLNPDLPTLQDFGEAGRVVAEYFRVSGSHDGETIRHAAWIMAGYASTFLNTGIQPARLPAPPTTPAEKQAHVEEALRVAQRMQQTGPGAGGQADAAAAGFDWTSLLGIAVELLGQFFRRRAGGQ